MGYRQFDRKPTSKKSSANPIPSPLQMRPFAPPPQPDETPELQPQPEDEKTTSYNFADICIFDPDSPPPPPPSWNSSPLLQSKWEHPHLTPSTPVQPKLAIGQPNDKYEQEADRVASQVVQRINNPQPLQREEMPEEEEELQMKPESGTIQREEIPEEEELQMKSLLQRQSDEMTASPELETSIETAKGSGQSLADNIREPMEQAFGADFSGVKIHTDSTSNQLNQSIQAKAFTTGQDIFFRQGAYQPESRGGQELLAHELTHVVQQSGYSIHAHPFTKNVDRQNIPSINLSNYNSSAKLQRFSLSKDPSNPQLNIAENTENVELSKSGAIGIFKFRDETNSPLIVKPDPYKGSVAELSFSSDFHKKIAGAEAPMIRKSSQQEFNDIKTVINSKKMDWQEAFKYRNKPWHDTADSLQKHYNDMFNASGYALLMSTVKGDEFEHIKQNDILKAKQLLQKSSYLNQIGMVHAIDLFFGNTDRFTGNLGNWLTDSDNIIGAIDNVNTNGGEGIFGTNFRTDADEYKKLAKNEIDNTVAEVVEFFIQEIWEPDGASGSEDDTLGEISGSEDDTSKENSTSKEINRQYNYMYTHIKAGLIVGKKKIIHKLGSRIFGKRSRTLKTAVTGADPNEGSLLWKNVKKRVKQIEALDK
jgi:hypothetical protein